MKNDLISREALKEHKFLSPDNPNATRFYNETTKAYQKGWNDCIDAIIDNAPTVKTFTLADIEKQYRKGLEKGLSEWETERPQGEWEKPFEMNGKSYHKCTNCHISSELILIGKFCPNCGAKMLPPKNETF